MTDQRRTPISAAIDRIGAALDTIEEEPASMTESDFIRLKDELARMVILNILLEPRFNSKLAERLSLNGIAFDSAD
ncbi:MAG: hypothetical protein H6797_03315 [Candidatus Nomurabacteria bacterium]|nr:MAG: hypothetical protein H6797_03315 [Candidatus Nomurabacteria bacterium]